MKLMFEPEIHFDKEQLRGHRVSSHLFSSAENCRPVVLEWIMKVWPFNPDFVAQIQGGAGGRGGTL